MAAKNEPIDVAALLRAVSELQKTFDAALSPEERAALPRNPVVDDTISNVVYSADERPDALEDFALQTAAEALAQLAEHARAVTEQKMEKAYRMALDVYYAVEDELARNPDNEELAKHAESMRRAHESQYGRPIPERE